MQAFYHNGTTYFVADGIASTMDLVGLLKHEIGVHALKMGKDDAGFKSILKQLESMRGKNAAVDEAFNAAERAGTSAANMAEEALGYFVEKNPKHKLTDRILAWLRNAIREIGRNLPLLSQSRWFSWANSLTPNDLHYMVTKSLRNAPESLEKSSINGGDVNQAILFAKVPQNEIKLGKKVADPVKVNGNADLWTIPDEVEKRTKGKFPAKPIRLLMGKHFGEHRGFGLAHIKAGHTKEISATGMTAEQWVVSVIKSTTKIYDDGSGRLLLHSATSPKGSVFIELRDRGGFYSVVTAYDAIPRGKEVWSGRRHLISTEGSNVSGIKDDTFATTTGLPINPTVRTDALANKSSAQARETLTDQTTGENIPQPPSDSIKFSKTQPSSDFELPEETMPQKQQRLWQDMNNRWKTAVDAIKAKGGKINESNNAYDAMERMPHIAAERITDFKRDTLNPLIERVALEYAELNFNQVIIGKKISFLCFK